MRGERTRLFAEADLSDSKQVVSSDGEDRGNSRMKASGLRGSFEEHISTDLALRIHPRDKSHSDQLRFKLKKRPQESHSKNRRESIRKHSMSKVVGYYLVCYCLLQIAILLLSTGLSAQVLQPTSDEENLKKLPIANNKKHLQAEPPDPESSNWLPLEEEFGVEDEDDDKDGDELKLVRRAKQQNLRRRRRPSRRKRRNFHTDFHHRPDYSSYVDSIAERPLVSTQKGLIRGITQKLFTGKVVDAFLGIPFAQPPIGKYRFRHPQPVSSWPGELDASKHASSCFQVNDTFFGSDFVGTSVWNANTPLSEDCLYLNIWAPFGTVNTTTTLPVKQANWLKSNDGSTPSSSTTSGSGSGASMQQNKRAVLVWIFGGGFYSGTSSLSLYEGGVLASEEDIIVVSINYRVSSLGFLYFGRPDVPGNAGLFDQLMALQWINDNIEQFGGDPSRVTIFGESAGAVSVSFHLLSPLSRNLFSQAILQSGAATCPWGSMGTNEIVANGLQLASLLNCPANSSNLDLVVECLLRADPMALVSQEVGQSRTINFPFVPVVDGSFLLESPAESLTKLNFKQAKILLGSNYDEGNAFLIYLPELNNCPISPNEQPVVPNPKKSSSQSTRDPRLSTNMRDEVTILQEVEQNRDSYGSNDNPELLVREQRLFNHPNSQRLSNNNMQDPQRILNNNNIEKSNDFSNKNTDSKPCKPSDLISLTREEFLKLLKEDVNPFAEHPLGKEAIVFEYSNWNNPSDSISNYDALDKIVGDYFFTCHVNEFAQRYAIANNEVYMYYFKQRSSISPWPKWMGVLHADEIFFVFGEPLNQSFNYTTKEVELSKRMMKYWANFAKFGNPTSLGDNMTMSEKWPDYADKKQYFELHADYIRIGRGPRAKQCAFWAHYLPKLIENFDRNQCPNLRHDSLVHPFESPPFASHYGDPRLCSHLLSQRNHTNHFFANIPSSLLISLSVIFILIIVALLIYAKQTWIGLGFGSNQSQMEHQQQNEHQRGGIN